MPGSDRASHSPCALHREARRQDGISGVFVFPECWHSLAKRWVLSIFFLKFKDRLCWFAKKLGNFKSKDGRGNITSGLDRIDSLPAHANGSCQFLLGNIFNRPLYFYSILHLPVLLIALIVKLNLRM